VIDVNVVDRVVRVEINRPQKRNALNVATCQELLAVFERAELDPAIGAVLLLGKGPAFCAGMDLEEVVYTHQQGLTEAHERLFTTIERARKPIVAGVEGPALAAGMGLAANCHIVIAAPEAQFGLTEIRIGLWPIIVFRAVVRAIGERRATELSLTGRTIGADEAMQFGLVAEISGDPKLRALETAKRLSEFSPAAVAAGLEYVDRARGLGWAEAAAIGHKMRDDLMATKDFAEGVRAFLEKRPPEWPSLKLP
jgi:methylglutaconyl-CoA hydratase